MRLLLACLGAPIISFALLLFMAGLINKEVSQHRHNEETPYFDLLMVNQDESFTRKIRHKAEPPKPMPHTTAVPSEILEASLPNPGLSATLDLPSVALSTGVMAMAISMPGIETMAVPSNAQSGEMSSTPLYRVEPRYPRKALRLKKQGYVLLSFDINEEGRVSNIQVLEAAPEHLFEKEARQALKKWKYKPMLIDGKPVTQTGQKIRLDFKMDA
ncbi:energy transducer TonB [Psychromonas sp.]|uniref:energy transducer TonB n=1 Tax=Psychromonas sp. TaxID=1884585 RepID=UPI003567A774